MKSLSFCVVGLFVQVSCPHKEKGEGIYCFTTLMEVRFNVESSKLKEPFIVSEFALQGDQVNKAV